MWLILISTSFICLLVWDYSCKSRRIHLMKISGITGPKHTLPIIGDVLVAVGNNTLNVFSNLESLCLQFGKVVRLWLFHRLLIVVKDPKYFEVILTSPNMIKKPFLYDMLSCWLGNGLLLSSGTKWHSRRKIFTPAYHFKILEGFVEVFDRQSSVLIKKLQPHADGKQIIDVFPIVCLTALDIIAETAMGVKINAQKYPDFPYTDAVTSATNIIATRAMKPVQYFKIGFILTAFSSYLRLGKSVKIMQDFASNVINNKITYLQNKNATSTAVDPEVNDVGQKKRMAFLDVLLQARIDGKPLKNEDIREEVDTFMFGGHDTVTSASSFCLYLLARHAEAQQKVFEEIITVIGEDRNKAITMRDLQELKYLEAVIKESLRLYPVAPIILRYIEEDVNVDGQIIPANTNVALLVYAISRDPDYFANPNEFQPERFYSETAEKIKPFTYVPFSAGPRNCIGQKFAMLEMKSTLSKMIRHFELLPLGPDVVPVSSIVLRSATGINLGLKPRIF